VRVSHRIHDRARSSTSGQIGRAAARLSFALFAAAIAISPVDAQSGGSFIRSGSIGVAAKPADTTVVPTVDVHDWVGKKFMFMPKNPQLRQFGYQSFEGDPPYASFVGRVITATSVDGGALPTVVFVDSAGKRLRANAYSGTVDGIGSLSDLEYARQRWNGKTLWVVDSQVLTWDEERATFGEFIIPKYSPVHIDDVVASTSSFTPIRFILRAANGNVGYIDASISGTNIPLQLRQFNHFGDQFLEVDPRTQHNWPAATWALIERGRVAVGMTLDQALLAWGKPTTVNNTSTSAGTETQLVYPRRRYLNLKGGMVTAVQE
jgi:hypothetical protein